MEFLLTLSVALLSGLLASRVVKKIGLPAVTAYLVAGVIIGPYILGRFNILGVGFHSYQDLEHYKLISEVALGFIAFAIGNEFRLSNLKKIGKKATIIGIFQALFTSLLVDAVFISLHFIFPNLISLEASIVLGAIAAATAPAATLMVIKQYKAKGKVTEILLPVVALDDAVGLIIFAISFGIAKTMQSGDLNVASVVLEPLLEVVCSLALGAVAGVILTFLERFFHSNSKRLSLVICLIILTVGLAMNTFEACGLHIGFSSLLVLMMMGTVFCNICDFSDQMMEKADKWSTPLLVLFFVISGAELDLSVFTNYMILIIGFTFIFVRCIGKYLGAFISCKMTKCDKEITKYLGITLFPQAGVALGMCIKASTLAGEGPMIRNVILLAVLVYELVGPYLTKIALVKSGDITLGATSSKVRNAR